MRFYKWGKSLKGLYAQTHPTFVLRLNKAL